MADLTEAQVRTKHIKLIHQKIKWLHETLVYDEANLHEMYGLTQDLHMLLELVLPKEDTDD